MNNLSTIPFELLESVTDKLIGQPGRFALINCWDIEKLFVYKVLSGESTQDLIVSSNVTVYEAKNNKVYSKDLDDFYCIYELVNEEKLYEFISEESIEGEPTKFYVFEVPEINDVLKNNYVLGNRH